MNKKLVIAGIGTDVGKTVAAAIITEALQADYWKPVQAGALQQTDTDKVGALVSNTVSRFHPEKYRLKAAMSPHAAAALEGIELSPDFIQVPPTNNTLVIELAGGVMVPLNTTCLNLDLLTQWNFPVLLVSHNYLGSINHTLMTTQVLRHHNIEIAGILFNGAPDPATEEFISDYTGIKLAGRIGELQKVDKKNIGEQAQRLKQTLTELIK